jgi:hypothetical protein
MKSLILALNVVCIYLWFRYRWNLLITPGRSASIRSAKLQILSCCLYLAYALGIWYRNH